MSSLDTSKLAQEAQRVATAFEVVQFGQVSHLQHFLGKRTDAVPVMWLLSEEGELLSATVGSGKSQCAMFRSPIDSSWICAPHRKFNAVMVAGLRNLGLDSSEFE